MNIEGSSFISSIESFQFYIPLTSTPKRSNFLPLSSTLAMSMESSKQFDLSISAITLIKQSPVFSYQKSYRSNRRRRNHIHVSTIIKRIELKYLLYSTRVMKSNKQRQYTNDEMKIYVV